MPMRIQWIVDFLHLFRYLLHCMWLCVGLYSQFTFRICNMCINGSTIIHPLKIIFMDLNLDAICTILHLLVTKNPLHSLWELEGTTISLKNSSKSWSNMWHVKKFSSIWRNWRQQFFCTFLYKKSSVCNVKMLLKVNHVRRFY